jgi:hypothetical protein
VLPPDGVYLGEAEVFVEVKRLGLALDGGVSAGGGDVARLVVRRPLVNMVWQAAGLTRH